MRSFPFDSLNTGTEEAPVYDRAGDSSSLAEKFALLFSTGVFADPSTGLQVVEATGMNVIVKPGNCNINGYLAVEDTDRTLAITAANATYDRIDRVVARLNLNLEYRDIDLYVLAGTPAITPVAPNLTRTSLVYEIALADLFITKNATSISQDKITDQRLNSSLCGVVTALPSSIDTEEIFLQYQSALNSYLSTVDSAIDETLYGKIKGLLSLEYNPTEDYSVGDYTIYSDVLYKCNTAITGGESWTAAHWGSVKLAEEVSTINNNLTVTSLTVANSKFNAQKSGNVVVINKDEIIIPLVGGWNLIDTITTANSFPSSIVYGTGFLFDEGYTKRYITRVKVDIDGKVYVHHNATDTLYLTFQLMYLI
jgi:hypothetical protein